MLVLTFIEPHTLRLISQVDVRRISCNWLCLLWPFLFYLIFLRCVASAKEPINNKKREPDTCLFSILRFLQDPATRINNISPRRYVHTPHRCSGYIPRGHLSPSCFGRLKNLAGFRTPKQASINAFCIFTSQRYNNFCILPNTSCILLIKIEWTMIAYSCNKDIINAQYTRCNAQDFSLLRCKIMLS